MGQVISGQCSLSNRSGVRCFWCHPSGVCGEGVLFFGVLYSERDSRRWMASSLLSAFVCEVAATCCFQWILSNKHNQNTLALFITFTSTKPLSQHRASTEPALFSYQPSEKKKHLKREQLSICFVGFFFVSLVVICPFSILFLT